MANNSQILNLQNTHEFQLKEIQEIFLKLTNAQRRLTCYMTKFLLVHYKEYQLEWTTCFELFL